MMNVMKRAWEIYRTLTGDHVAKLTMALKKAWVEAKNAGRTVKEMLSEIVELVKNAENNGYKYIEIAFRPARITHCTSYKTIYVENGVVKCNGKHIEKHYFGERDLTAVYKTHYIQKEKWGTDLYLTIEVQDQF